jgi:hypothetical protein
MEKISNVEVNKSPSAKLSYKSPKLVDYGSVSKITAGTTGLSADFGTTKRTVN